MKRECVQYCVHNRIDQQNYSSISPSISLSLPSNRITLYSSLFFLQVLLKFSCYSIKLLDKDLILITLRSMMMIMKMKPTLFNNHLKIIKKKRKKKMTQTHQWKCHQNSFLTNNLYR